MELVKNLPDDGNRTGFRNVGSLFLVCSCSVCYCVLCVFSQVCLFCIVNLVPLRVVISAVAVSLIAICVLLASRVYVCVCVCDQVGCSVVSNWSLCDFFVDVCVLICSGFIFCL
jgi:hypothetical protein